MKKYIALLLSFLLIIGAFSGCSIAIAGLAILIPYMDQTEPTEAPTNPSEDTEPAVTDAKEDGNNSLFKGREAFSQISYSV